MSPVAVAHTAFGFSALLFGTINVLRMKGTPSHRLVGHAYYVSMLGLNGTAMAIYDLFGSFGVFHWLGVISLCTLFAAIVPAAVRRPRRTWKYYHGYFMLYSYLGLVAAAAAELAVRLPPIWTPDSPNLYFVFAAALPTVGVSIVGAVLIRRTMTTAIRLELRAPHGSM